MNLIGSRIEKLNSRMKPKAIRSKAIPATRDIEDRIVAMVADKRLKIQLKDSKGVEALRSASLWRLVLGSVVVRRTMMAVGKPLIVNGYDGKPIVKKNGRPKSIRNFRHSWAVCPPYEFIRDPSASTLDFDDEDVIGHEKPRTVDWLQRNYGVEFEKDQLGNIGTMGDLLEFQAFLGRAMGQSLNTGWQDSKAKAVMVSEWWYSDPETNEPWSYWMLGYRNTRDPDKKMREIRPLMFGKNPYSGLPLHHFWYLEQLLSPWGRGVPHRTIHAQNAINIAFVSAIRTLILHANPKWIVQSGSLVDKVEDSLTNRTDVPCVYKAGTNVKPPERLSSASLDSTSTEVLKESGGWLDNLLNMAPVQAGQAVARGEAGKAYEVRLGAADTPIIAKVDDDERIVNDLLTGTLHDISKTDSLKSLSDQLGGQFPFDQIALFKSKDSRKALTGVQVVPDSLRPKTPDEIKQNFEMAIQAQMIDPIAARRSMLVMGGGELDVREAKAYRMQQQEIQAILAGQEAEVFLFHFHEMHQWTIGLEAESTQFASYSQEQRDALQRHWAEHEQMKGVQANLDAPLQAQAGQGQVGQAGLGGEATGTAPGPAAGQPPGQFGQLQQALSAFGPEQSAVAGSVGPEGAGLPNAGMAAAI